MLPKQTLKPFTKLPLPLKEGTKERPLMTLTSEDEEWIESELETLYRASCDTIPADYSQVREYIDVYELGLALNLLAHIHLKLGKRLPPDKLRLFDALATRMGMKDGDDWHGVAELRKLL